MDHNVRWSMVLIGLIVISGGVDRWAYFVFGAIVVIVGVVYARKIDEDRVWEEAVRSTLSGKQLQDVEEEKQ